MSDLLQGLESEIRRVVVEPLFRTGAQPNVAFDAYLIHDLGLGRAISLEPLRSVIEEAMTKPESPEKTDPWLAPRVHATLRLTRREAADKRLWSFLTIAAFPRYVLFRYLDEEKPEVPVPIDRFLGEDSKNAIARLWWAAELTRNGADYSGTVTALSNSRFATSWQHLDLLHHRPAALAIVGFCESFGGKKITDYQGQVMSKALNLTLRTINLDSLWQDIGTDAEAIREWLNTAPDPTKMMAELPVGPDDAPVTEKAIGAVREVLERLADEIGLSERRPPRKSEKKVRTEQIEEPVIA
jgi:hypothetical protein